MTSYENAGGRGLQRVGSGIGALGFRASEWGILEFGRVFKGAVVLRLL